MKWFKMWTNFSETELWTGNIDNEELGAWVRLLRLAAISQKKGIISIDSDIPLTENQLLLLLKTDKNYIKKWEKQGAISNEKGVIKINNWSNYQSDYQRQKPYREKVTTKSYNAKLQGKVTNTVTQKGAILKLAESSFLDNSQKIEKNDNFKKPINTNNIKDIPKRLQHKVTQKVTHIDIDIDIDRSLVGDKPADSRVKGIIDYFFNKHLKERREKYHIDGGKDGAIIKNLLKTFTQKEIIDKIDAFFTSGDAFIEKAGYSIGVFKSQVNKLKTAPAAAPLECDDLNNTLLGIKYAYNDYIVLKDIYKNGGAEKLAEALKRKNKQEEEL